MSSRAMNNEYVNSCLRGENRRWRNVPVVDPDSCRHSQSFSYTQCGLDTVFMETIEPIGAAKWVWFFR